MNRVDAQVSPETRVSFPATRCTALSMPQPLNRLEVGIIELAYVQFLPLENWDHQHIEEQGNCVES
jgi:hypothetical protein